MFENQYGHHDVISSSLHQTHNLTRSSSTAVFKFSLKFSTISKHSKKWSWVIPLRSHSLITPKLQPLVILILATCLFTSYISSPTKNLYSMYLSCKSLPTFPSPCPVPPPPSLTTFIAERKKLTVYRLNNVSYGPIIISATLKCELQDIWPG